MKTLLSALTRLLPKLLAMRPRQFGHLVAAGLLLAIARWKLAFQPMKKLIEELRSPLNLNSPPNTDFAKEIASALRKAALIVPWRADCLVRAIAARQWAKRSELPFEFHLGVSLGTENNFQAHAWTLSGRTFLSGEIPEIASYREFDLELLRGPYLRFSE